MPECLEQKLMVVEASSPGGLEKALNERVASHGAGSRYLSVLLQGPRVLVRQFELTNTPAREIRENLLAEASELLSLTTDEIALEYQLLETQENTVRGVYLAVPKDLLAEYVAVLDRLRFYPVRITAYPLAASEAFLELRSSDEGIVPFFDLSREGVVSLAVFKADRCMLLREIPVENRAELEKEIIQTLRWAYSKRNGTGLGRVYFSGKSAGLEDIAFTVRDQFKAEVLFVEPDSIREALCLAAGFFTPNLARPHFFSRRGRSLISKVMNTALCLAILFSGVLAWMIAGRSAGLRKVTSAFSQEDYRYAVKLEQQLKEKRYAK